MTGEKRIREICTSIRSTFDEKYNHFSLHADLMGEAIKRASVSICVARATVDEKDIGIRDSIALTFAADGEPQFDGAESKLEVVVWITPEMAAQIAREFAAEGIA
jgi:hypothetical protein